MTKPVYEYGVAARYSNGDHGNDGNPWEIVCHSRSKGTAKNDAVRYAEGFTDGGDGKLIEFRAVRRPIFGWEPLDGSPMT